MNPDNQKLIEILYKEAYVSGDDIAKAAQYSKTKNTSLTDALLSLHLINKIFLG